MAEKKLDILVGVKGVAAAEAQLKKVNNAAAGIGGARGGGGFFDQLGGLKKTFGRRGAFGDVGELLVGGGALAGVTFMLSKMGELATKAGDVAQAWRRGEASTKEMADTIVRSIPIVGQWAGGIEKIYKGFYRALGGTTDDDILEKFTKQAEAVAKAGDIYQKLREKTRTAGMTPTQIARDQAAGERKDSLDTLAGAATYLRATKSFDTGMQKQHAAARLSVEKQYVSELAKIAIKERTIEFDKEQKKKQQRDEALSGLRDFHMSAIDAEFEAAQGKRKLEGKNLAFELAAIDNSYAKKKQAVQKNIDELRNSKTLNAEQEAWLLKANPLAQGMLSKAAQAEGKEAIVKSLATRFGVAFEAFQDYASGYIRRASRGKPLAEKSTNSPYAPVFDSPYLTGVGMQTTTETVVQELKEIKGYIKDQPKLMGEETARAIGTYLGNLFSPAKL